MWWVPAVVVSSYIVKKVVDAKTRKSFIPPKSTVEKNFERLHEKLSTDSYKKITIIGQPGAGKSTLIHKVTNGKCIPKPTIGIGTDATDWSDNLDVPLYHTYKGVRFIDTPGYNTAKHPVASFAIFYPFEMMDYTVLVINGKIHQADQDIFQSCYHSMSQGKLIVIRSFVDSMEESDRKTIKKDFEDKFSLAAYNIPLLFISNRTNEGIEQVRKVLKLN
ncbi:GTPase [Virgibacillus sp. DJP39]|uniref:GTPase domain-containing protein n=1 Tax=Virgibacillus sp. DJP39 TaxID=3409790 RepID=UPI003BB5D116